MEKKLLKKQFNYHKYKWKYKTRVLSNISDITNNYHYQKIISLGSDVVPMIIDDMKKPTGKVFWYRALEILTKTDPVEKEHRGHNDKMRNDWFRWWDTHCKEYQ